MRHLWLPPRPQREEGSLAEAVPIHQEQHPQKQAAVRPAQLGGGCPCWFEGMGGHYLPCWPPTGEHVGGILGWLPLALVSRGDPGPPVIPSDVAGGAAGTGWEAWVALELEAGPWLSPPDTATARPCGQAGCAVASTRRSSWPGDTQLGRLCSLRDPGPFLPPGLHGAGPDPHLFPLAPPL